MGNMTTIEAKAFVPAKDFALAKQGGFSGTARSADGDAPVDGALVRLYNAAGQAYRPEVEPYLVTRQDGSYVTYGLPDGTYYAELLVLEGAFAGVYLHGGPSCLEGQPYEPCQSATSGLPIVVAGGQPTGGVDFLVSNGDLLFKSGFE